MSKNFGVYLQIQKFKKTLAQLPLKMVCICKCDVFSFNSFKLFTTIVALYICTTLCALVPFNSESYPLEFVLLFSEHL